MSDEVFILEQDSLYGTATAVGVYSTLQRAVVAAFLHFKQRVRPSHNDWQPLQSELENLQVATAADDLYRSLRHLNTVSRLQEYRITLLRIDSHKFYG